jgi:hypothetical protein
MLVACAWLHAAAGSAQPRDPFPCEEYSRAAAVFVGVAGAPVKRWIQLPDHPPLEFTLAPMKVERAFRGVTTEVVWLTPLGVETRPRPGERYLVFGRSYRPPDIVMASPGHGAIAIERAAEHLAFLESLQPQASTGIISGVVQLKDRQYDGRIARVTPLAGTLVAVSRGEQSADVVTGPDGRFALAVPAGTYDLSPDFPDHIVRWDSTSRIQATVVNGGCAVATIDAQYNGRIRGTLTGPDGRPLSSASVDLLPMDNPPDSAGHVRGEGSVSTDLNGEFEFAGRPAGRYLLGVNLDNQPRGYAPAYPRTYYPGTTDPDRALPVVIQAGQVSAGLEFAVTTELRKGELEVTVRASQAGELKVCLVPLDSRRRIWTRHDVSDGVPLRLPIVEGHRYDVHAHLSSGRDHLESEPVVFTATAGKTAVSLVPDAPRDLDR